MSRPSTRVTRASTRATIASDSRAFVNIGGGPIDVRALLDAHTLAPIDVEKRVSWDAILEGHVNEEDIQQPEPVLFSKLIKKSKTDAEGFVHPEHQFCTKFQGPYFKETPLVELSKKPGVAPINKFFHYESHRVRRNSDDDGLDSDDITAIDGIVRRIKTTARRESRRESYIYEALRVKKGEFIFPHRTYRPKVQVAYRVPPGQVPQAVAIERLHRLYKKTDINVVCQNLGIEISDLIPPPHYGETNERFYQESMFRNRVKISGLDKREFIRTGGGRIAQEEHAEAKEQEHAAKPLLKEGSSDSSPSPVSSSESEFEEEEEEDDDENTHPFIKSKPPFGAQFPLEFFDNEEYDIRSGEEWIRLGYDPHEKKMYPIPGKAFLPMPAPAGRRFYPALSEVTSINLLKKTETLEKFRKWLVKERFRRQLSSMGVKDGELDVTDDQMQQVARATSTVPTLIKSESGSTVENGAQGHVAVGIREGKEVTGSGDTSASDFTVHGSSDDLMAEKKDSNTLDVSKAIVWKQDSERASLASSGYDMFLDEDDDKVEFERIMAELTGTGSQQLSEEKLDVSAEEEEELVKQNASLLDVIFADPAVHLTPELAPKIGSAIKLQESVERGNRLSRREINVLKDATSSIASAIIAPHSPDVDPFDDDGYEKLVYEYNKMKKTHNYDWKWVDVAAFDYNPKTRMYFVRSILEPYVFAWVNKVYLVFDGEDPSRHGERIKDAITRRMEYEYVMRYNLYIDCLPIDKAPEMESDALAEVIKRATRDNNLSEGDEKAMDRALKEVNLEYKRTHMKLLFDHIVSKHPKLYKPWVHAHYGREDLDHDHHDPEQIDQALTGHTEPDWNEVHQRYLDCATHEFNYKVMCIKKASVTFKDKPYIALGEIVENCLGAREKPLILINTDEPVEIQKYQQAQTQQYLSVVAFLRKEWTDSILASIRTHIGNIPKSWYNLEESRWDVFEISKTKRFLTLVRFMAEDTLRYMVEDSLTSYVNYMKELTAPCANISRTYKWVNDLKTSDFPPPEDMKAQFLLHLIIDEEGPKFSDTFADYARVVLDAFNTCIDASNGFRDITQLIMKNLLFGTVDFLRSVDKVEPKVTALRDQLIRYIKRSFLPVDIYAQLYSRYTDLYNTDVNEFIQAWSKVDHTAKEVKAAVEHHKRHKQEIQSELPTSIDICAFRINVDGLRQAVLAKKDELIHAVLESYSKQLRAECAELRANYDEILAKLTHSPRNAKEIDEFKEYRASLPPIIADKDDAIHKLIQNYEVFEKFKFPVPFEEFEERWDLAMDTCKILKLYEEWSSTTALQHLDE